MQNFVDGANHIFRKMIWKIKGTKQCINQGRYLG